MKEEGWLMKYMQEKGYKEQGACITVPRVLFGCKETIEDDIREDYTESLDTIDPFRLDTIRWRFHSQKSHRINQLGKVIIDASQVGSLKFPLYADNPHQPFKFCHSPWFKDNKKSEIWIYHYLSSWEQYTQRDDGRKGNQHSREVSLPSRGI
jgi:hypothetical protein